MRRSKTVRLTLLPVLASASLSLAQNGPEEVNAHSSLLRPRVEQSSGEQQKKEDEDKKDEPERGGFGHFFSSGG